MAYSLAKTNMWCKMVWLRKYLQESILKCLAQPITDKNYSALWKFCKASSHIIQIHLTSITSNVHIINIQSDTILGKPPLQHVLKQHKLKTWMIIHHYNMLTNISEWEILERGTWISWRLYHLLNHLFNSLYILLDNR